MFNNQETVISREFILTRVTQEQIFSKYLGLEPNTVGSYVNPLRDDNNPSCGFYIDSRGIWKFKDFAAGYNWDCFNVVEWLYRCSFKEALIKVAVDFNMVDQDYSYVAVTKATKTKRELGIRIKRRGWTKADLLFWHPIKPERLEFFRVTPISHAWLVEDNILRSCYVPSSGNDVGYAYHFGDYNYKLYFPNRTRGRFIHTNSDIIQGYNQLPQVGTNLVITKSYKDVIYFDLFREEFDLYSIAPMSETVLISPEAFGDLYNRFDNIATLFDFDRTGIRAARSYQEKYYLPFYLFGQMYKLQGIKDFTDHVKKRGVGDTRELLKQLLNARDNL